MMMMMIQQTITFTATGGGANTDIDEIRPQTTSRASGIH
jgi:hypothetical protein